MKTIKINESQRKRLFEAYTEGFSFDKLSVLGRGQFAGEDEYERQYNYCEKYLGKPISDGSARTVFQLDDNFVLKLAAGYEGFKQNENEIRAYQEADSILLTKIGYYDEDYSFIVSEHVLPAAPEDFEKFLGLPYYEHYQQESEKRRDLNSRYGGDKTIGFDKYFDNIKPRGTTDISVYNILRYIQGIFKEDFIKRNKKLVKTWEKIINDSWWFTEIRRLVNEHKIYDLVMNNFGVAYRNNEPVLVILDSGISVEDDY